MKKIVRIAKLQFPGNQARPGPTLASIGVNIMEFCNQFNKTTEKQKGVITPVVITVYNDKSFDFIVKTTPTAILIKKYAKLDKGASKGNKEKLSTLTLAQVTEIATYKLPDLNTNDVQQAIKIVLGTMKQMGVQLEAKKEITDGI